MLPTNRRGDGPATLTERLAYQAQLGEFMLTYDWRGWIRTTWEVVVYVARYGNGQQVDMVADWPISKLRRVAEGISKCLELEAKKARSG